MDKLRNYLASVTIAALMIAVASQASAAPVYSRSGPWWARIPRPLFSMAYTPEPSDYDAAFTCIEPFKCKYFDSDFYNSDFDLLWSATRGGRNDLGTLHNIHVNNVHLYDWSTCRNHGPFLDDANRNGITVWVPFSNFNVLNPFDPARKANIENIVREIYGLDQSNHGRKTPAPGALLWGIGNEFDINFFPAANVAHVAKIIVDLEKLAGITDDNKLVFTSPVSFGALAGKPPAIQQILDLQRAFIDAGLSDVWYNRFMASTATTNDAAFIQNYVTKTFPESGDFSVGDKLSLFLSEYGANGQDACLFFNASNPSCSIENRKKNPEGCICTSSTGQDTRDKSQADYDAAAFKVGADLAKSPGTPYFYGFSVFQWQDAFWKCPGTICTESQFGIQKRGTHRAEGTIGGGKCGIPVDTFKYPVPNFVKKPAYNSAADAFAP
jgi:hypothetical protein